MFIRDDQIVNLRVANLAVHEKAAAENPENNICRYLLPVANPLPPADTVSRGRCGTRKNVGKQQHRRRVEFYEGASFIL